MCKTDEDILKLGLLFGSLISDEASVDEQPEWLTFAHKLFQDFAAGFYISKTKVNVAFHSSFCHELCQIWQYFVDYCYKVNLTFTIIL